jgi:pepF/M3 family oligoendopeptidase
LAPYAFHISEELLFQSRQMSPELEDLAEDLGRNGADAWSRLQDAVSSGASALWNAETGERKTAVELRNLAYDPDRTIREKAYNLELSVWRGAEIPLAAALNGVKGTTAILNARRGWEGAIDKSLAQARISHSALDALISAMEGSLPLWRRYLKAKAKALGIKTLAFYDLFAPLGSGDAPLPIFSWDEAKSFIYEKFSSFDPAMGAFAARAFENRWIDARPRAGKVGGAYCTEFPDAGTARVMCNYDGSFSSVTTVAHELGHAWHHECIKDRPFVLTRYPMTLAETASIFAETIVSEAALVNAGPAERRFLLEMHLQDGCQVIVDILSRFYFEKAVFEARKSGELSPEQLCGLMLEAQDKTYGEGLDAARRHPYMWAVKGHYYIPSLSYYNFPYAFGQLFGLGLYARYREEGPAFAAAYRRLLADTGSASAIEVTRKAGFDIETEEFWREGLGVFARQTEEFEGLVQ